jgi:hypothetical protein
MEIRYIIAAAAVIAALIYMIARKKTDGRQVQRDVLSKAVKKGGILYGSDLKSFSDPEKAKLLINSMIKDGTATVNVTGSSSPQYMFPAFPVNYRPLKTEKIDEFNSALTGMGMTAEDGQVYLSEIVFAFDMDYGDIIEALEMYLENEWVTRNVSKSGNVYFMFDKDSIEV